MPENRFGFEEAVWEAAREEGRAALIERAGVRGMMPYSELVRKIHSIQVDAHDVRLFELLGEISTAEDAAGRGMLSALVVHKEGDMEPGHGFFELAAHLGRDTRDQTECCVAELKKVYKTWQRGSDDRQ